MELQQQQQQWWELFRLLAMETTKLVIGTSIRTYNEVISIEVHKVMVSNQDITKAQINFNHMEYMRLLNIVIKDMHLVDRKQVKQ